VLDEDPNQLERYVGDYVFNPKNGQNKIPLGQPAEVREIGTGFMMVRRKTFEVYAKAYPYQSYKPDHVRTAAFDGTREIMAYFDCIIDRGYGYEHVMDVLHRVAAGDEVAQKEVKDLLDLEQHSSKRYLSEDYMFCYNCDKANLKVWFCPWMKLQHVGSYVFSGSLADLASIGASATADAGKLGKK